MTLDSVAHLLPGMRAASAEESVRTDFAGLLEVLPSSPAGSGSIEVEELASASNSGVRRTVSRVAVALAASGVFFTGVGSICMHEAMPMSATTGGQSHRMADGTTMTKAMPTAPQLNRAPQAAPMPSMPAAAPAADSGPPRPLGAGTAVPIPTTTGTSGNTMVGSSRTAATATTVTTATSGRSTHATPRSAASSTRSSSTTGTRSVVHSGDDFGAVGARFGLSADRIAALNPGIDPTQLSIGQSLRVR